jgi:hypothetical protein
LRFIVASVKMKWFLIHHMNQLAARPAGRTHHDVSQCPADCAAPPPGDRTPFEKKSREMLRYGEATAKRRHSPGTPFSS